MRTETVVCASCDGTGDGPRGPYSPPSYECPDCGGTGEMEVCTECGREAYPPEDGDRGCGCVENVTEHRQGARQGGLND
jgi:RecJ-like exonuclease